MISIKIWVKEIKIIFGERTEKFWQYFIDIEMKMKFWKISGMQLCLYILAKYLLELRIAHDFASNILIWKFVIQLLFIHYFNDCG